MSAPERDPREAVLEDWRDAITARASMRSMNIEVDAAIHVLARLDAADPLRQKGGEVELLREALGDCEAAIASVGKDVFGRDEEHGYPYRDELLEKARRALNPGGE